MSSLAGLLTFACCRTSTIRKMAVSAMSNNVYLLTCTATGAQLLVDAADDAGRAAWPWCARAATGWTSSSRRTSTGTTTARCGSRRGHRRDDAAGADDADALPVPPDRPRQGDRVDVR